MAVECPAAPLRRTADLTISKAEGSRERLLTSVIWCFMRVLPYLLAGESNSCHTALHSLSLQLTRKRAIEMLESFSAQVQQRAYSHTAKGD